MSKKVSVRKSALRRRWLVAIDPFSDLSVGSSLKSLRDQAAEQGAELVAAYVLAPASLNWTGDFSGAWQKRYQPMAQEQMAKSLSSLGIKGEVLVGTKSGTRSAVDVLLKHARKIKADRIVVASHARRGIERWILGSFAETIILSSKIPVEVFHPEMNLKPHVSRIIVPVDIDGKNGKTIKAVTAMAKAAKSEVVLFYKEPNPLDPIVQQGVYALGGGWVSLQSYLDDAAAKTSKKLKLIADQMNKSGACTSYETDSSVLDLVSAIVDCAKRKSADLIVVSTKSGPVGAAVLGSVARGLVRHGDFPILVVRD